MQVVKFFSWRKFLEKNFQQGVPYSFPYVILCHQDVTSWCTMSGCVYEKMYRSLTKKGPWMVHLSLSSNEEVGRHSSYSVYY